MIEVSSTVMINENEIQYEFIRASGPGGQNVNKVATACQLRFDVRNSPSLAADVKARLIKLSGSRLTDDGVLIIEARRYRTQEQNRLDALTRLIALVQKALEIPKIRRKTRPTLTSSAARVDEKKRRGVVKRTRLYRAEDWD